MSDQINVPKPEKPTPPPSQIIKEGSDPSIRTKIVSHPPQTEKGNSGKK
jgi:hypothetical protein